MPSLINRSGSIPFYGQVSWANFIDWFVTICLVAIIASMTTLLGGIRAETHLKILPLYGALLFLHGLWVALTINTSRRISLIPVLFLPFIVWLVLGNLLWNSVSWRGWQSLIYVLEGFLFFWVFVNNVRTRAHLAFIITALFTMSLVAALNGLYQFFHNPASIVGTLGGVTITLSELYHGQATGTFADPNSFAVYVLILLPVAIIATVVRRFPYLLRALFGYISIMLLACIIFTQVLWAIFTCIPVFSLIAWLCFERSKVRIYFALISSTLFLGLASAFINLTPSFAHNIESSLVESIEGTRLEVWVESLRIAASSPFSGKGAGSFSSELEQSSRLSTVNYWQTPHSDVIQFILEHGLIGVICLALPLWWIISRAYLRFKQESVGHRLKSRRGKWMPMNRMFLSMALSSVCILFFCCIISKVFVLPAFLLIGALAVGILVKLSFTRTLIMPQGHRVPYFCILVGLFSGISFAVTGRAVLAAQAHEAIAAERLNQIVTKRVHISGDVALLDSIFSEFNWATMLCPGHVDAWVGLSVTQSLKVYQRPEEASQIGLIAKEYALNATTLSQDYWRGWAQLGVAYALCGDYFYAENAFEKALELAPNNSNTNYQWGSFLSHFPERRAEAISAVQRSLEINPENQEARRLRQKLLLL